MNKLIMLNNLKKKLAFFVITTVILSLLTPITKVKAATLFEDNFDSGNANNWNVIGTPGWTVQNGQYGIHVEPGASNTIPNDNVWNYSWTKIAFDVDLIGNVGVDKNILLKFHDTSNFLEIHANDNGIYLDKASSVGGAGIQSYSPTILQNGINYHFRSEINNDKIKVYLDNNLLFDVTESQPAITNWKIGLRSGTGSTSVAEVWFDNVVVSDLPSNPLPSLNVQDIKQYTAPWGPHVYDTAKTWSPTDPTIKTWGCALTSADMILQYYGFSINPDSLNTWLNSQSDGYIYPGLLNWLAISRYSKTHANNNQPSLEFLRKQNTNQNLIDELTNNRPAILEEPGHFIVAKSQTQNSFGINDPAYSNHPDLTSYGNAFQSLETYTPSHTDLSYIMLAIDPNFNIKVLDTNNNEITGDTFIQNPLINDTNNSSTSGSPVKFFMFPKPANGNYSVQITGNGIYELDSYLYDPNGNVNLNKLGGILGNNEIDNFKLTIGQNNKTNENITINSIIQDLLDAKSQSKIKTDYVYQETLLLLNTANKALTFNQRSAAKGTLNATIKFLQSQTSKNIDQQTSQILQSEIKNLIDTI